MPNDHEKIRITSDDVERVIVEQPAAFAPPPPPITEHSGSRNWGRIDSRGSRPMQSAATGTANVLFKAWIYLGLAGVVGAFIAWALFEPSFKDHGKPGVGNLLM